MSEAAGRRIGPYRLERELGRGSMGVVYAAWDERLERRVALKEIVAEAAADPQRRERFRREALALARFEHPAIVGIHDLLESPEGYFLVLQFVDGPTLAQRLRQGPLAPPEVAALAGEVAGALAAAHRGGWLHRDLKAENVILPPGGGARVLDFGLARLYRPEESRAGATLTAAGIVGTYRAMSPEQANGFPLGPSSDLFALGVLLYEAATAVSPFLDASPVATLTRVCTHRQPPARELRPELPASLSELIDWLLEKDPARRPASAEALLARLASSFAAVALPGAAETQSAADRTSSSFAPISIAQLGRRPKRILLALGLAAVAAVGLYFGRPAPMPLYVVVARPELAGDPAASDGGQDAAAEQRLVAAALAAGLLRSLASLDGVVALAADPEDGGSAARLAVVNAADEVLGSSLECTARRCRVTLRRQQGREGRVLAVQSFEAPSDDPWLLATAADTYLKAAYPGFAVRRGERRLEVRAADQGRFLRLQQLWDERRPADLEPLLAELAQIRAGSPALVDAWLLEANLLRRRFYESRQENDLERALAAIEEARRLAPGDPQPPQYLFNVAIAAGLPEQAEQATAELERLLPGDAGNLLRRGLLAEARGDGAAGIVLLREAADRRPSAACLLELAKMELRQGQQVASRQVLENLLERIPGYLAAEKLLAQLELQSGSPERAAELYERLLLRGRGFTELSNLGLARLLMHDWQGAAGSLEEAWRQAPGSAPAALNLADALFLAGRREEAAVLYARVLELAAADPDAAAWQLQSVKAQALAHLGRAPEAAGALQAALAAAPGNVQVAYEAALVHALLGEKASALASARRAVDGGFDRRWLAFSFFDGLRGTAEWEGLIAQPPAPPP